jgi:molybdopterin synthase sulfur carrier subunit
MEIECVFFGPLQETAGTKTTTRTVEEATTVTELVAELVTEYDGLEGRLLTEEGALRDSIVCTINKRHISQLDGESTTLSDGDTVRLTTSIQGG